MSDLSHFWWQAGDDGPNPGLIGNSLRFRGDTTQKLYRTNTNDGTSRPTTFSMWLKLGNFSQNKNGEPGMSIVDWCQTGSCSGTAGIGYQRSHPNDSIANRFVVPGIGHDYVYTGKQRDPSAWYHLFLSTANSTTLNGFWINGVKQTNQSVGSTTYHFWNAANHTVGIGSRRPGCGDNQTFDGYISEAHFGDGVAHAVTDFGEFNAAGAWVPKKVSGVTYGTNGWFLDFSDPANIGADRSGNGNNFTPTGFELTDTTSTSYDWMADSPTNNFATGNILLREVNGDDLWREGNLRRGSSGTNVSAFSIEVPKGAKLYCEVQCQMFGVLNPPRADLNTGFSQTNADYFGVNDTGDRFLAGARSSYMPGFGPSDTLGMWMDTTNNTLGFVDKNGVAHGSIGTIPGDSSWQIIAVIQGPDFYFNAGQRPFKHTPPAGFEPLSTAGLADVPIKNPSEHFQTILDSGANILTAAQAKFPNGLWWIKDRVGTNQHQFVDSVRGNTKSWDCPATNAESTYSAPSGNSVAWCWATDNTGLN